MLQFLQEFSENHPDFKAIFPEMMDYQLKTAPKGFAKDHPLVHLLRYKSNILFNPDAILPTLFLTFP